jgi:hypothetical protein
MTAKYLINESDEFSGATIYIGGETRTVNGDHPSWDEIVAHLRNKVDDDAALLDLIDPAKGVASALTRLSERVTFAAGTIYFDGDVLENALTEHIIRLVESGKDDKEKGYPAFVKFLEKLATNPSKKSRKHLFHFIENHGITIHPDGDFIAYKGVTSQGNSINHGYGIVDGVVFGEYDPVARRVLSAAALPNAVGSVVEVPRAYVDDDRSRGCSTGLHAGTYEYANGFAQGQLLTVKINPRDVVSVPSDSYNQKLRVSRYEVLEINTQQYTSPVFDTGVDDGDFEDDSDLAEDDLPDGYYPPEQPEDDKVSDDDLADALSAQSPTQTSPDGSFTVTVTVTPSNAPRDSKGRFLPGDANPGKAHPRDSKGHFIPLS